MTRSTNLKMLWWGCIMPWWDTLGVLCSLLVTSAPKGHCDPGQSRTKSNQTNPSKAYRNELWRKTERSESIQQRRRKWGRGGLLKVFKILKVMHSYPKPTLCAAQRSENHLVDAEQLGSLKTRFDSVLRRVNYSKTCPIWRCLGPEHCAHSAGLQSSCKL